MSLQTSVFSVTINSPLGPLRATASTTHVLTLAFGESSQQQPNALLSDLEQELRAYFKGALMHFTVPYKLEGTAFQRKVWEGLCSIPYGDVWSYQKLATFVGNEKASRAVGLANRSNPLMLLVPCHRVIQKNGTLGGYFGGLSKKKALLAHESLHKSKKQL